MFLRRHVTEVLMKLIYKGEGVDLQATFDTLEKRISALENKDKPAIVYNAATLPLKSAGKGEWTPSPPKKA